MNIVLIGQGAVWFITMFVNYGGLLAVAADPQRAGPSGTVAAGQLYLCAQPADPSVLFCTGDLLLLVGWHSRGARLGRFPLYGLLAGRHGRRHPQLPDRRRGRHLRPVFSLFFAYAWMWPDQQILLFFFIPVKVKWIGWISGAVWLWDLVTSLLSRSYGNALSLVVRPGGFPAVLRRRDLPLVPRHHRQLQAPPGLAEQVEMIPAGQAFCLCAAGAPRPQPVWGCARRVVRFPFRGVPARAAAAPFFSFSGRFYP